MMNERIKNLSKKAWLLAHEANDQAEEDEGEELTEAEFNNVFQQKFAELIVRECAGLCNQAAEENARTFYTVTETKEVGPALVAKGSQVQAEKLSKQIKKHFGVKE